MLKPGFLFVFFILITKIFGQQVEVQANYNSVGDVDFVAYNNSGVPLFLNIDFADLENTSFNEPLPYIKMIEPGFNTLFTLQRDFDAELPRFNYQIKYFRSNPAAEVNLEFPYLLPFAPGTEAIPFDVKAIAGFMGSAEPKGWLATGFTVTQGREVFASRNGIVVEVAGAARTGESQTWYHTWNNTITLLQPDGTLICYRNVVDKNKIWVPGYKVFAGQKLGEVAPRSTELILLIFHHSLNSDDFLFVIPQFVTGENKTAMLVTSERYKVFHPDEIRGLEMNSKEKRKILK